MRKLIFILSLNLLTLSLSFAQRDINGRRIYGNIDVKKVITSVTLVDTVKSANTINIVSEDTVIITATSGVEINTGGAFKKNSATILTTLDIPEIKKPFWLGEDIFPLQQCVYKDTTFNNLTGNNYIVIQSLSGSGASREVVLNWIPYRTSLISPTDDDSLWAMLVTNSWQETGTEPNRSGDDTEIVRVDSGNYSEKKLYCTSMTGSWTITGGDTVIIYNPFAAGWEWCQEPLFAPDGGSSWRQTFVMPGPIFKHSDGYLRMFVGGSNPNKYRPTGLVKFHPDSIFYPDAWHILNSDQPILDTCAAKGRGTTARIDAIVKSNNEDNYIAYVRGSNDEAATEHLFYLTIDEDGNILYDEGDSVLTNIPSNDAGEQFPTIVQYGSKYLMLFCNKDTYGSIGGSVTLDNWTIHEAYSNTPFGPFEANQDSILATHYSYKMSYRSGYSDMVSMFLFKNRIYALVAGTSIWHQSGSKANRQWGIAYRTERDGNPYWIEDPRSPLWINIMQKYVGWTSYPPIWGTGTGSNNNFYYASDHSGGVPTFYSGNDGYIYVFFACNASSNDYRIWAMRLNSELW